MNILCSAVLSPRADSIKIRAGLKGTDKIGTPEAANGAEHPDPWRSVEDITCCCMYRGRRRSPEVCFTVAVMKKPDNLCLDILLRESELLWEDVMH